MSLEENVTEDGDTRTGAGLDTTVALTTANAGVVDVAAGSDELLATDDGGKAGKRGGARENVTTLLVGVLGAGDLGVVGVDNVVGEEHESGASVSNGRVGAGDGGTAADRVAGSGELPEAVSGVDRDVSDGSGVLGGVDVAKVVRSRATLLQVDGEELASKGVLNSVKEGGLLVRAHGVDGREGKSKKTVVVSVLLELSRDGGSSLDSLGSGGDSTNNNLVGVDNAGSTRAIAVANVPSLAAESAAVSGVVNSVAGSLRGGLQSREDPEIGGSSVKVEVQGGTANRDGAEVLRVAVVGVGSDGAALLGSSGGLLNNAGRSTTSLVDGLCKSNGRSSDLGVSSGNLRNGELDIADAGSRFDRRSNSDGCNCSNGSESLLHGGRRKRLEGRVSE